MTQLDTIYNEDCLEGMKRIPDGSVDAVVTSPPYDNQMQYGIIGDRAPQQVVPVAGDNQKI